MINDYPDSEPNGQRVFLIETSDINGIRQITARVLREATAKTFREDCSMLKYNDGNDATGYRNATWLSDKKNALYVENFVVSAYISVSDKHAYGCTNSYRDCHQVELREACAMSKSLMKLNTSLENQASEYGYTNSSDYTTFLLRTAKAFGITKFLTYRTKNSGYDSSTFRVHNPTYLSDVVANLIDKENK